MEVEQLKQDLKQLHTLKGAITRLSNRGTRRKYAINSLLNSIKENLQKLESIPVPPGLVDAKQKAIDDIKEANEIINQEHRKTPLSRDGFEEITSPIAQQADRVRDALMTFDSRGLDWISRNARD